MTISADDVRSPGAIVDAVYRILSGRADEARDWASFEALCEPGARMIPVAASGADTVVEVFDVDAYRASRAPLLASADFYERDIDRRVEEWGHIAQVWSTYEASRSPDGPPFMRGAGSIQLIYRADRWWIVSSIWQASPVEPV